MKNILFLTTILLSLYSCNSWEDDLTNKRTPYTGKEFRIDGYYSNPNSDGSCHYLFFYANGILLSFNDSCYTSNNTQFRPIIPNSRDHWAIFEVEGTTITRTYWADYNMFGSSISNRYYRIENDTTLLFTYNNNNFYYHFKQFSPKPDSTNVYIK